jgi:hypothetical protein
MTRKTIKNISIALVVLASVLLILEIIHVKMVSATEKGLWDFMPPFLIHAVFIAYPVLLLTSYLLFLFSKKEKTKIEFIPNVLFLLNGITLVVLLVIYAFTLLRNL